MARATARDIAEALGRNKHKSNGSGSYQTFCPCHDDRSQPSLSVKDGKDGRVLVHCHAGCNSTDVIGTLRDRGLWAPAQKVWVAQKFAPTGVPRYDGASHPKLGKPTHWWEYVDVRGKLRGYVARFDRVSEEGKPVKDIIPITWCQCAEDGLSRWWWKGFPEPRSPLYESELPQSPGKHILIVEGEKTCDAAKSMVGETYTVLCWQGGTGAVKRTDWSNLKDRDVTLWPDADIPGDQAMRELAEILLDVGAKVVRRVELPSGLPKGWDLADEPPKNFDIARMLYDARQYTPLGDEVVERFNKRFALTMVGGQAVVLEEEDTDSSTRVNYLSVNGFNTYYGNKTVPMGKVQVPESQYWLKHEARRSYKSVTFKPTSDTPGQYNLWRGFTYDPDPTGSWDMMQDHILYNVARGDESLARWVTGWFAHIFQHPDKKMGTSLSIRGKMGTGKTILGQAMGQLIKPHYVLVDRSHDIVGNFNAHMTSCLLLHADESFFAGDPRNVGHLRGMVTSDTIRIEPKGKDSFELRSYMRLLTTSNNSWVIPAGFEERRFAVLDIGEGRMQDKEWFQELLKQMTDGGYSCMLHDLLKFDLTTVDVGRVPRTAALQEQKIHSVDPVTRFWLQCLHSGEVSGGSGQWPAHVVLNDLHEEYVRACISWGEPRRLDQYTFNRELKKYWPVEKKPIRISDKRQIAGKPARPWAVETGTLWQHRKKFSQVVGGNLEWSEETEEELIEKVAIAQKTML